MQHENIVKLYDFFFENKKVYLIMDYAENGNLFFFVRQKKNFKKITKKKIFYEVCKAIEYMHSKGIIHRDLKPENILINKNYKIKLCDFGWSAKLNKSRKTFCGTYEYMAPEIFSNSQYNQKVDIWSLGILLYELYHGYSPYRGKDIFDIYKNILHNKIEFRNNLDPIIKNLILNLLKQKKEKRPNVNEILKHQYFYNFVSKKQTSSTDKKRIFLKKKKMINLLQRRKKPEKKNFKSNYLSLTKNKLKIRSPKSNREIKNLNSYIKNLVTKNKSREIKTKLKKNFLRVLSDLRPWSKIMKLNKSKKKILRKDSFLKKINVSSLKNLKKSLKRNKNMKKILLNCHKKTDSNYYLKSKKNIYKSVESKKYHSPEFLNLRDKSNKIRKIKNQTINNFINFNISNSLSKKVSSYINNDFSKNKFQFKFKNTGNLMKRIFEKNCGVFKNKEYKKKKIFVKKNFVDNVSLSKEQIFYFLNSNRKQKKPILSLGC